MQYMDQVILEKITECTRPYHKLQNLFNDLWGKWWCHNEIRFISVQDDAMNHVPQPENQRSEKLRISNFSQQNNNVKVSLS